MSEKQKKKLAILAGIVAAAVLVIILALGANSDERKKSSLLELGDKYLSEMDYESALAVYDQVLSIDPKCEEAYLGKADAQFSLGMYEAAIETLQEGLAQIGESAALTALLQSLQEEYAFVLEEAMGQPQEMENGQLQETENGKAYAQALGENESRFLVLNYSSIVEHVDSEETEIQLEVIGDKQALSENIVWESTYPEVALVSEEGLVTLTGAAGMGRIIASDGELKAACSIRVADGDYDYFSKSKTVNILRPDREGTKEDDYFAVLWTPEEGNEVALTNSLSNYVYYSGNVEIPDRLSYNGEELLVTALESPLLWCDEVERVTIPASVREIGTYQNPFLYCDSLQEIVLEEGSENYKVEDGVLYTIDGSVLLSYPAAKEAVSFTVPAEVTQIAYGAFFGCRNLQEILVEKGNTVYESIDGVLVQKENYDGQKTLLVYPGGKAGQEYTVPEEIGEISSHTFVYAQPESIVLGEQVKNAGTPCFYGCESLKSITMTGMEWVSSSLFENCSSLEELELGAGVKTLQLDGGARGLELELKGLEKMSGLESLRLYNVSFKNAEGLSWTKGLVNLKSLQIEGENLGIDDLTPLKELKNLTMVSIFDSADTSLNAQTMQRLAQQLDELKSQNPDCNYSVLGLE